MMTETGNTMLWNKDLQPYKFLWNLTASDFYTHFNIKDNLGKYNMHLKKKKDFLSLGEKNSLSKSHFYCMKK